jgi:hypothetical protein
VSNGRRRLGDFRPSSVYQHRELRVLGLSAREMFPQLRACLLGSRPLLKTVPHPHLKDAKGKPLKVEVFGPPTFRNVIDPKTGAHV